MTSSLPFLFFFLPALAFFCFFFAALSAFFFSFSNALTAYPRAQVQGAQACVCVRVCVRSNQRQADCKMWKLGTTIGPQTTPTFL